MRRVLPLILAALLLTGCVGSTAQDAAPFAPAEEDRLVVCTSHKEKVYAPIIEEFEQRTGVWVEVHTGSTAVLLEQIAAGGSGCDVMFGGGSDSLSAYRAYFSPYVSENADALAPEYDVGGGDWTPFSLVPMVLVYNTKLVRQNFPTGWSDLLDPGWRGRIAFADPTASGSSYSALCTFLQVCGGDTQQTLAAFYRNLGGKIIPDSSEVIDAVADGSCYIGVTLEENARKAVADGLDIAIVYPAEGTCVLPDGAAVVRDCAHEDNARAFLDFLLLSETQQRLSDELYRRGVRADAEDGTLPALNAVEYSTEQAAAQREALLDAWQTLCGEAAS